MMTVQKLMTDRKARHAKAFCVNGGPRLVITDKCKVCMAWHGNTRKRDHEIWRSDFNLTCVVASRTCMFMPLLFEAAEGPFRATQRRHD